MVTFELPGGTRLDLATLFIPAGATNSPAKLSVSFPLPASSYLDGDIDLDITLKTLLDGGEISLLNEAFELRTWTPTGIPNLRDENESDFPMELLNRPELSNGIDSGYYQFQDGSIQIISKRLSRFTSLQNGKRGVIGGQQSSSSNGTRFDRSVSARTVWDRNKMLYAFFNSQPYVLVDLRNAFGGKEAIIQLRRYVPGGTTYINLGKVTLSDSGNATFELKNRLLKSDRLRLLIDGERIVFHNVLNY